MMDRFYDFEGWHATWLYPHGREHVWQIESEDKKTRFTIYVSANATRAEVRTEALSHPRARRTVSRALLDLEVPA
jgi:hypothetical protein